VAQAGSDIAAGNPPPDAAFRSHPKGEPKTKKNGSREGLRLPSASPLLGIEASGKFTEGQVCRFSGCVANHGAKLPTPQKLVRANIGLDSRFRRASKM
jgi:hypothetical protein